jgi:AcrR family transcriptional regulator
MPRLSSARKQLLTAMMKETISDAAVAVLAEHGVEGMTMDRVAAAADVAKGSLYCYFDGKQDILRLVHAKLVDPILKTADDVIQADMPATRKLEAVVRTVFDQLARHHGVFSLLIKDATARNVLEPRRRTNREIAVGQFAVIFRQGIEQGLFARHDPAQVAEMFMGALGGLWERSLATGDAPRADSLTGALLSVFLDGISVRDATVRDAAVGGSAVREIVRPALEVPSPVTAEGGRAAAG